MAGDNCKYHVDHENRIERLEKKVENLEEKQKDPRWFMAVLGLVGVVFSTIGSFLGVMITAYLKIKGIL